MNLIVKNEEKLRLFKAFIKFYNSNEKKITFLETKENHIHEHPLCNEWNIITTGEIQSLSKPLPAIIGVFMKSEGKNNQVMKGFSSKKLNR